MFYILDSKPSEKCIGLTIMCLTSFFSSFSYLNTKKKNTSKYIKIINSEKTEENNILKDITADGISHFKYALVT